MKLIKILFVFIALSLSEVPVFGSNHEALKRSCPSDGSLTSDYTTDDSSVSSRAMTPLSGVGSLMPQGRSKKLKTSSLQESRVVFDVEALWERSFYVIKMMDRENSVLFGSVSFWLFDNYLGLRQGILEEISVQNAPQGQGYGTCLFSNAIKMINDLGVVTKTELLAFPLECKDVDFQDSSENQRYRQNLELLKRFYQKMGAVACSKKYKGLPGVDYLAERGGAFFTVDHQDEELMGQFSEKAMQIPGGCRIALSDGPVATCYAIKINKKDSRGRAEPLAEIRYKKRHKDGVSTDLMIKLRRNTGLNESAKANEFINFIEAQIGSSRADIEQALWEALGTREVLPPIYNFYAEPEEID